MKKIFLILIICICAIALVESFTQSHYIKKTTFSLVKAKLQNLDLDLEIGTIESTFPEIRVENVVFKSPLATISAKTVQANISIFSLFKNKIVFNKLIADHVTIVKNTSLSSKPNEPSSNSSLTLNFENISLSNITCFEKNLGNLKGQLNLETANQNIHISANGEIYDFPENPVSNKPIVFSFEAEEKFSENFEILECKLENQDGKITAKGLLSQTGELLNAQISVLTSTIHKNHPFEIQGKLLGQININQKEKDLLIHADFQIPNLTVHNQNISFLTSQIELSFQDNTLKGSNVSSWEFLNEPWKETNTILYQDDLLQLLDISITNDISSLSGNLKTNLKDSLQISGKAENLSLPKLVPEYYGSLNGNFWFIENPLESNLQLELSGNNLHYDLYQSDSFKIFANFQTLSSKPEGSLIFDFTSFKYKDLHLDYAIFETTKLNQKSPFSFTAKGKWKHPLTIDLQGHWETQKADHQLEIHTASGTFYNHNWKLNNALTAQFHKDFLQIPKSIIEFGKGTIEGSISYQNKRLATHLNMQTIPVDFLSLNPLDIPIEGQFNMDLSLEGENRQLTGDVKASFTDIQMPVLGRTDPLNAHGKIEASLNKNYIKSNIDFAVRDTPLLKASTKLPFLLSFHPFSYEIPLDEKAFAKFYLSGYIEDFLDFFDLGNHRIEGFCVSDLTLENTLNNPEISGQISLKNGYYQNYYTGTELQNIQATLKADENMFVLEKFQATDLNARPSVSARGNITIDIQNKIPFDFKVDLTRFQSNTMDLISSDLTGTVHLYGNLDQGFVRGKVDLLETDLTIPNRIPESLPNLEVTYKNAVTPPYSFSNKPKMFFPIDLNLEVLANDSIFLEGRGIDSEWKGNVLVTGTQTDPVIKGRIELIKGKFSFSGKDFILKKGSLKFGEKPNSQPIINLSGTIAIKDVLITANITGPLNNPQITFQSSPPLPLGSIFSYLIFGQDSAEISSVQALELAVAITSLSSTSSVIKDAKSNLGIDRLEFITVPDASSESGEQFAVQVGKYVTEDVLVSYSQTAEYSAGNISIEVALKGGASFILESDQADEQRQGKFTLRWTKTY